jgi:DNA repair/transcription protein MET18/MMS19
LATFAESYSPIADEIYISILKSFTLIISGMDKNSIIWKSTQEALIQIGLVAEKSMDRRRAVVYTTMVVEELISTFVASTLPFDLSLEALYGIGTVGKNQMEQVQHVVEEAITVKILKVCLEGELSQAEALISLLQFYSGRILLWYMLSSKYMLKKLGGLVLMYIFVLSLVFVMVLQTQIYNFK